MEVVPAFASGFSCGRTNIIIRLDFHMLVSLAFFEFFAARNLEQ